MQSKIKPCLWFDNNAHEAAKFYTSLFPNSRITAIEKYSESSAAASGQPVGSEMTVAFELAGLPFLGLNGGPVFKFTPAISLFVSCNDENEIATLHAKFTEGGMEFMPLQEYPFAKKFAWVGDRFGLSWQLILDQRPQKIWPSFLFVGDKAGKAVEAMEHYTSIFPNSKIETKNLYGPGEPQPEGMLAHGTFVLDGYRLSASESNMQHDFDFNSAISLMVTCNSQSEIDSYWNKLSQGGAPVQCGWLTDKYGVSWQIVPAALEQIMQTSDAEKKERTMAALMHMVKIDIAALQNA